jgi:predicted Zn-dependent protease
MRRVTAQAEVLIELAIAAAIVTCPGLAPRLEAHEKIASPSFAPLPREQTLQSQSSDPESELQTGIQLTRQGRFQEAIPHFLAAQGHVSEDYAENFNLALCYVATGQNKSAIQILTSLANSGHATAEVDNLLAQAYVGDGESELAFEAIQRAAELTPQNEKLYLFVADACMEKRSYGLGLKVLDLGLRNIPNSPAMHYERALFLTDLERYDLAKNDYEQCKRLAPESDFAFLSSAKEDMSEGNIADALSATREGVGRFPNNYILLQFLGEALIHSGVAPGQPSFVEAQTALEKSVSLHPNSAGSQVALGKLYLMENRLDDAIAHLQSARQLDPEDTSVYSHLATAYRRKGEPQEAQKMLSILASLNDAQAGKIRAGPPARAGALGSPDQH